MGKGLASNASPVESAAHQLSLPLDSAATLSITKTFRVYKTILDQASFLEALHAWPRWIPSVTQIARLAARQEPLSHD